MMNIRKYTFTFAAIAALFLFRGCSYMEYFMVKNLSDEPVEVTYELDLKWEKGKFPLFRADQVTGYRLKESGEVVWEKRVELKDEDAIKEVFHIVVPPKTALNFGYLNNDSYERYDQDFINSGTFNLRKMTIDGPGKTLEIVPETFDDHFFKKKGQVQYIVK